MYAVGIPHRLVDASIRDSYDRPRSVRRPKFGNSCQAAIADRRRGLSSRSLNFVQSANSASIGSCILPVTGLLRRSCLRTLSRRPVRLVDQLTLDASEFRLGQVTSSMQIPKVEQQILRVSRRTGIFAIPGPHLQRDKDQGHRSMAVRPYETAASRACHRFVRNSMHWRDSCEV